MEAYGYNAPPENTCGQWFKKLKNHDFNVTTKKAKKHPDEDPSETENELAIQLNVSQQFIS